MKIHLHYLYCFQSNRIKWPLSVCLVFIMSLGLAVNAAKIELRSQTTQRSEIVVQQGDIISLEVFADVGQIPSSAAEIYLSFEPDKLRVKNPAIPFDQGDFYNGNVALNKSINNYEVGFAIVSNALPYPKGEGVIAKIRFVAIGEGTAEIKFNVEQEDWDRGKYTFFTQFNKGQAEPKSFKDVVGAKIQVKNTLLQIDKFGLQRFVYDHPGDNINLDDFAIVSGSEGKPILNWTVDAEDKFGRPIEIDKNAANQLIIRPVLPQTREDEVKVALRLSLKVGESLAVDSTVIYVVNQDVPIIKALPELRFRTGAEGIILLDNYVQDEDNKNAELKWEVGQLPVELKVSGVSLGKVDRSKGIVDNPPRLAFRTGNPINSEQHFDISLKVTDPDGNYDTATMRIVVEPLPFVRIDLVMPSELTLLRNEEHKLELTRYTDIEPKAAIDEIVWDVSPSEHVDVLVKNLVVVLRPQQDWVGSAEKIVIRAIFEGKKIDESSINVTVFDLPEEKNKTFPIMLIRNPIAKNEFKVIAVLSDVSEMTAAFVIPKVSDILPQTVNLKKIGSSRDVWFCRYSLSTPPSKGQKLIVSIVGKDTRNQNIPPSTNVFEF